VKSALAHRVHALVAAGVWAALAATLSHGLQASRATASQPVTDGAALFTAHCVSCHGADGRGAERGPDIVTSAAAQRRTAVEVGRIVRDGIPSGGMPPGRLDADRVTALATFVRSLADAARVVPTFPRVTIEHRDGRRLEGLVQNERTEDLQLLTKDGDLVALARDEIARVVPHGRDPMPTFTPRAIADRWTDGDWPTYNGDPAGNRHTALRQIASTNVGQLRLKWITPLGSARTLRMTPLVIEGIMYASAPNEVYALDARSGRSIWRYARPRTPGVIGDAGAGVHRGVAVRGDRLYTVTDDAKLLALHRGTGQLLWEVTMADYRQHYGATGAPLVVGKLVVSGISGGDEGARGFIAAFDAETGKEVWRFWTVPAPGEPGSETWRGKAIAHPCAATWLTGSYDATNHLLLWTTGNPCPDYNGVERQGDNLWSNSVVALDPETGVRRWHYQFTPHDLNDWDAVQTVVSVDTRYRGQQRQILLQANRNGFFYVLDRQKGAVLLAKPFVKMMNWATGIGEDGRPQRIPGVEPTVRGLRICPSVVGATNWMSPAFNPDTRLYYVMALERCSIFRKSDTWFTPGTSFYGGTTENVRGESGRKVLRALDIETGAIVWEREQHGAANTWGGVLSTATGLVFYADDNGDFAAVDARTGQLLWRFDANTVWHASPMAYAVGGQQFIAIAAGGSILAFGL
jgi:alcohol dehydrogenase (cytochrome c)